MKARDDDLRLWAVVAATVRPLPGRTAPTPPPAVAARLAPSRPEAASLVRPRPAGRQAPTPRAQAIEPGRYRRLVVGRETLGARIDLHGLTYDAARGVLGAFIEAAAARGVRGVLVITGKGALGDGVLRRHVPEWLAQAPLRALVAGISEAHRRHGGAGALYVALRRQDR